MTTKNRLLQVRVTPEQFDLLHEYSAATGAPVSWLVRTAVDAALQRTPNGAIIWEPTPAVERAREKLGDAV